MYEHTNFDEEAEYLEEVLSPGFGSEAIRSFRCYTFEKGSNSESYRGCLSEEQR